MPDYVVLLAEEPEEPSEDPSDILVTIDQHIQQFEDTYCNNSLVIISYLDIFLVTTFIVIGFVFVCKLGKWIEFLFSDR